MKIATKILAHLIILFLISFSYKYAIAKTAMEDLTSQKNDLLSLNFQQISVREALQMLAQFADINMIIGDTVQGEMSVHLQNLSWQQALNTIIASQNLTETNVDGVIRIESKKLITTPSSIIETADQQQIKVYRLNYAKADDVAKIIQNKSLQFYANTQIVVDQSSNSLILQGKALKLASLINFIHQLDQPEPQILIEARIVSVDSNYEKELGVRFGLTAGNSLVDNSSDSQSEEGAITQVNSLQQLNVDLPALASDAGNMGIALFKVAGGTLLDLELSALESEGHGQIISRPQLLTANHQPATIQAGEEIPYQESTASGATSVVFKKAVLSLQVTPQIMPQQRVLLYLQVHQDNPSAQIVHGVPAIDTRQISTQILANNGQTIVLGGIYEDSQSNGVKRIPFFGNLPVVGGLFRYHKVTEKHRELLIFVTAKIVKPN